MGPSGDLCNSLSAGEIYSLSQSQVWPEWDRVEERITLSGEAEKDTGPWLE